MILVALGYAAHKIKALPPETGKALTRLVLYITLPCTILGPVIGGDLQITGGETATFMLISLSVYLIFSIVAILTSRALGGGKEKQGLIGASIILGNVAFMGFPLAQAIFGEGATFYVTLFNIPFWIAAFTIGTAMISGKGGKFNPKSLLSPPLIAAILVIPLAIAGFRAPGIIISAVRLTGGVTTPASMLIVGITLAHVPIRDVFAEWRLYPMAFVKLIVAPLVTWLVLRLFISDELMLGVAVVLAAMPTAAVVAMIAIEHKKNERIASIGIFLTTLLSAVTIPLIVYFLLV